MQEYLDFMAAHPVMASAMLMIVIFLVIIEIFRAKRNEFGITPQTAVQLINQQQASVIDCRSADAYKQGHIIGAQSLPRQTLSKEPSLLDKNKTKPVIFVCSNGNESTQLVSAYKNRGYPVYILKGGMRAWLDAGMPIVRK